MAPDEILMKIAALLALLLHGAVADYKIGIGIADVTGPVAEIVFAGYAKSTQKGCGLHLRQFARAFIVEDDNEGRVLFVSVDACMVGHGLRKEILRLLNKRYGGLYTEQNFILSATHTHGTPGGHVMDLLFDISSLGFVQEVFDALLSGIVKAIVLAHESKTTGRIYFNSGELLDTNINRSPASYLLNPEEERAKYPYNVDKEMVQLKFVSSDGIPLGVINWYAVHGTSMNSTNCLVTSDNIGYASILFEKDINDGVPPGKGPFVAAFASSNLGDVSPNIRGPRCTNNGRSCDNVSSSCDGQTKLCIASGPGDNMYESTKIIAQRLYRKAKALWSEGNQEEVIGNLKYGQQFVNVSGQKVDYRLPNGTITQVKGCLSAMGYSFAAGTTDGPGEFDFKQGTVTSNLFWNTVRDFIAPPTKEDEECHYPKPILLATGRIRRPYQWQPQVVPIQVAILGTFVIVAVPGEFTTMSGRRLRNAIKDTVIQNGGSESTKVVIAGLSNIYSDYIVTPEEYQLQRYEGASTIYGPHTLTIYLHLYRQLTTAILKGQPITSDVFPTDISEKTLFSFVPPVLFDLSGWGKEFGFCTKQPPQTAKIGDVVTAKFIAGHPRNNVMHNRTFLAIEKLVGNDEWSLKLTDADWDTKFLWERKYAWAASSEATVVWKIGEDTERGIYRIRHFGHYKYIFGGIFPYEGISDSFEVI